MSPARGRLSALLTNSVLHVAFIKNRCCDADAVMQSGALRLGCSEMRYGVGGRISNTHQTWLQPRDLSACTTLSASVTTASLSVDEDSLLHQAHTSALSVNSEFDGPVGAAATAGAQSAADTEEQNCEASFFTLLDLHPSAAVV